MQRGVSTIFSPIQSVADRALKPARDLVNWFDETFDARGENARLHAELEDSAQRGGRRARRRWPKTRSCASWSTRRERRDPFRLRSRDGPGHRPLADGLVLRRDDRRRHRRRRRESTTPSSTATASSATSPRSTGGTAQVTLIADHSSAVTAKVVPAAPRALSSPTSATPATSSSTSSTPTSTSTGARRGHRGLARPGDRIRFPPEPPDRRGGRSRDPRTGGAAAGPRAALRRPPRPRPRPGSDRGLTRVIFTPNILARLVAIVLARRAAAALLLLAGRALPRQPRHPARPSSSPRAARRRR